MPYKERLRELYAELGTGPKGPQWAEMARRLNNEGLMSPNGKPWTGGNLKQNYERMAKRPPAGRDTAEIPQPAQQQQETEVREAANIPQHGEVQDTAPVPQPEQPRPPQVEGKRHGDIVIPFEVRHAATIPLELSLEDFRVLQDMIAERKAQRLHVWTKLPAVIPDFKPPKGSGTSIRLRQDFLEAAMKRAEELWPDQRVTVTRLLNWLLMFFAGIDADPELAEAPVQTELLPGNEAEGT